MTDYMKPEHTVQLVMQGVIDTLVTNVSVDKALKLLQEYNSRSGANAAKLQAIHNRIADELATFMQLENFTWDEKPWEVYPTMWQGLSDDTKLVIVRLYNTHEQYTKSSGEDSGS